MSNIEQKIANLEEKIATYEAELETAPSNEKKQWLDAITATRNQITELQKEKVELQRKENILLQQQAGTLKAPFIFRSI